MMEKKETIREPQESESRTQGLQTQKLQEERLELVLARVRRIPQEHFEHFWKGEGWERLRWRS